MALARVLVFVDYQNVHASSHKRFQPPGTPLTATHVDPAKMARILVSRRSRPSRLVGVRVYRGQPSRDRQVVAAVANDRQAAAWAHHPLVTVVRRPLRYPKAWPQQPAQEKGIDVALAVDMLCLAFQQRYDVAIVASRDTDLVPALEAMTELKLARVEVASWSKSSRLQILGTRHPWCHVLDAADYQAVLDPTDYTLAT